MKLALYYAPMTCALVPYVTLTEAGADFQVRNINTRSGENRSAHFERMKLRPSVQEVLAYGKEVQDAFARAA